MVEDHTFAFYFILGLFPKEEHSYCYQAVSSLQPLQVQGELHITKKPLCYFVVWSPTEFHYQVARPPGRHPPEHPDLIITILLSILTCWSLSS